VDGLRCSLMTQSGQFPIYSTVLAFNVSDQGIVRPSAFAVLELMVNSNVVGTCTGSSAGFIPFKIWSLAAPTPANVRFGGPKRTFGNGAELDSSEIRCVADAVPRRPLNAAVWSNASSAPFAASSPALAASPAWAEKEAEGLCF
jgi:hypothetical protein